MSHSQRLWLALAGCCVFAAAGYGQSVISARAGLIHYTQGKVFAGDKEVVAPKNGDFSEMKLGEVLRTEEGRAEVLLTPGVVLRIAENSSFKLVSNKLEDVRVELLTGSVLIEAAEVTKHDSIVLITPKGAEINFAKRGVFRIDADPANLRVYDGEAIVTAAGQTLTVKEGKQTNLSGVLLPEKFNKEVGDAFYRWAGRRSGDLAAANLVAAKSIADRGVNYAMGSWLFNPYFGCFTYVPVNRNYINPWGYAFYTPRRVETVYYRPAPAYSGNSSSAWADSSIRHFPNPSGRMSSSPGYSGGGYSSAPAPPPSSAPAAPAAAPRGADSGGSRGSGGGR